MHECTCTNMYTSKLKEERCILFSFRGFGSWLFVPGTWVRTASLCQGHMAEKTLPHGKQKAEDDVGTRYFLSPASNNLLPQPKLGPNHLTRCRQNIQHVRDKPYSNHSTVVGETEYSAGNGTVEHLVRPGCRKAE